MTLHPCVRCTADQRDITRLIRQAERRHRAALSTTKQQGEIAAKKASIEECSSRGHLSMERGREAARARHAAGREARG